MPTFFLAVTPGLEPIAADELRRIGLPPKENAQNRDEWRMSGEEGGGVTFEGTFDDLYRANLWMRSASRILVRLGDFWAVSFPELRKKAARLEWDRYLTPGQPVILHVTCHKSKLYHSDAVAERVAGAIADRLGKPSPVRKPSEVDAGAPPQMVVVRFFNDHCTISIDSSGPLLYRRGYRLETAKAPLRETLAAAMLLASGWGAAVTPAAGDAAAGENVLPLLDPFCGSGTIPIEAALMALGRPPGAGRRFAFMDWPGFKPARWQAVVSGTALPGAGTPKSALVKAAEPLSAQTPPRFRIQASDRDAGAVRIAQANAERAGVAEWIEFTHRAVSAIEPPDGQGWVVTNPPYGLRVSANKDVRNLYAQFGHVLRARCPHWHLTVLCNDLTLLRQMEMPLDTSLSTINGGVNVKIARGRVP